MGRARLLVVDPYPLFRQGVRAVLGDDPAFEIVGETNTAAAALRLAPQVRPDVLLASTQLPDRDGIELARRIKEQFPQVALVLLAPEDSDEELFAAIQVGALGFFVKDTPPGPFVAGLRRVARGESLLADDAVERPGVATRLLREFHDQAEQAADLEPLLVPLSAREMEILEQIARGNSNKLIARELAISDHTVKNHVTSILRKLAVNDRTGAVVYALRQGWIQT